MELRRVVIRDRHPIVDAALYTRPLNRAVLAAAALALAIQIVGAVESARGLGAPTGAFERLAYALVALLWLVAGLLVFVQRRRRRTGQLFLLSAAAGSIFLSLGIVYSAGLLDALLYATGLLLFPPLLVSFVRAFDEQRPWSLRELWLYLPPAALIWPSATALAHNHSNWPWRIGLVLVALYLIAAIVQSLLDLRHAGSPLQAAQLRALSAGLIGGTLPGTILFVVPVVLNGRISVDAAWLPALVLLYVIAMSYAVLLFEFSEADLIVRRGVVYGVLTLGIVGTYGILGLALAAGRSGILSPGGGIGFVAVTVLIGAAFVPVRRGARRLVDWLLYGTRADRWDLLQDLSARIGSITQPDQLGDVLVQGVVSALHLRGAFLLRRDGDIFHLRHGVTQRGLLPEGVALEGETLRAALGEPPRWLLLIHVRPLTAGRRRRVPDRFRPLDDLHANLFLPLAARSGIQGVLCLQPKLAHDAFNRDDLELLAPLARQASVALDNALLFQRLDEKVTELQQAYLRIAREQEVERARLARELHDGTSQEVAALITLASIVEKQIEAGHPARSALDRLRSQAEDTYQGVRQASHALRPVMLDDLGLPLALARYIQGFRETTGIDVRYQPDEISRLPHEVELALFRVTQECLENVRKHSGAPGAEVILRRTNGHISLRIADHGRGMPNGDERGLGLAAVRERIEAVGGDVAVTSVPGAGVRVEVAVPA